ncbi:MAG: nuclear transport factor 2 family protein [Pseudomonadota bacterium]
MTVENRIAAVVQKYLDGVARDDGELVCSAFHSGAVMTGHFNGEYLVVPNAGQFIADFMDNSPPISESSPNLTSSIDSIEVAGTMARVAVSENGLEGADFTTYFNLHEVDGEWCIATKATYAHA